MPIAHEDLARAKWVKPLSVRGTFHVKSASDDTDWHCVTFDAKTGITECECTAAFYGRVCWHRKAVHAYLSQLLGREV